MVAVGEIWAQVLHVCSMHFYVHILLTIRQFINRKYRSYNAALPIYEL